MLPKFSFMKDLKIFYYISMFTLHKSFTNVDLDCIFLQELMKGNETYRGEIFIESARLALKISFSALFSTQIFIIQMKYYDCDMFFFCSFQAFLFIFIKNYTNINNNIVVQCSMVFWRLSLSGTSNQ